MKRKAVGALIAILIALAVSPAASAVIQKPYATEPTSAIWNTYDPALHYYYQQLTDAEKRSFSAKYDSIALGDAGLWDSQKAKLPYLSHARVEYALMMDCPELMWFVSGYTFGVDRPDEAFFAPHADGLKKKLKECERALSRIRASRDWGEDDYAREIAADRYLVKHCAYYVDEDFDPNGDFDLDEGLRTAWAALATGQADSLGYASAMSFAMRCFGVPCIVLTGSVRFEGDDYDTEHAWNAISVDGAWYHTDVSWDDMDDDYMIDDYLPYMNLSSVEIRRTRQEFGVRLDLEFKNPQCTSKSANYYAVSGKILGENWQNRLTSMIMKAQFGGHTGLGVRFESGELYDEAMALLSSKNRGTLDNLVSNLTFASDEMDRKIGFIYIMWWNGAVYDDGFDTLSGDVSSR